MKNKKYPFVDTFILAAISIYLLVSTIFFIVTIGGYWFQ